MSPPVSHRATAQALADVFATTAAQRDVDGGTPKIERDALRQSGLLALSIPASYGGLSANWQETLDVVRILGRADSSVAHVFGFHHLMLATVRLFGSERQWGPWFEKTASQQWFWGNAINALDERTVCRSHDGWREFVGQKSFCSGALDSEMILAQAVDPASRKRLIAALPTARSGISVAPDWDNFGQRQTDSGTVTFDGVRVEEYELLLDPGPMGNNFASLRPLISQLILTNLYLGIAEGAFRDARHYTLQDARPWYRANVDAASLDPYVLARYGEFWVGLEGTRVLADRAAAALDDAWSQGDGLSDRQRGETALAIATAKVSATETGLSLCTRMFEVAGARATHGALRLDRHWRNLRTHTLHDPLSYKIRELGEWALRHQYPTPGFYS